MSGSAHPLSYYRKGLTAIYGAILITVPILWDRHVTQTEVLTLLTAWGTAAGVYGVTNKNGT